MVLFTRLGITDGEHETEKREEEKEDGEERKPSQKGMDHDHWPREGHLRIG